MNPKGLKIAVPLRWILNYADSNNVHSQNPAQLTLHSGKHPKHAKGGLLPPPADAATLESLLCGPTWEPVPCPALQHLTLSDTEVSLTTMLPLLARLTALQSLDLSRSSNLISGTRSKFRVELPPSCALSSSLTSLDLSNCVLTGNEMDRLTPFLGTLQSLRSLCMKGNLLDSCGMFLLSQPLRQLPLLATLDFSRCHIEERGMNELCGALSVLTRLQACCALYCLQTKEVTSFLSNSRQLTATTCNPITTIFLL